MSDYLDVDEARPFEPSGNSPAWTGSSDVRDFKTGGINDLLFVNLSLFSVGEVISLRLLSGPTRDPYCTVLGSLVYRDQYDSFLFFVLSCNLHSNIFVLFQAQRHVLDT